MFLLVVTLQPGRSGTGQESTGHIWVSVYCCVRPSLPDIPHGPDPQPHLRVPRCAPGAEGLRWGWGWRQAGAATRAQLRPRLRSPAELRPAVFITFLLLLKLSVCLSIWLSVCLKFFISLRICLKTFESTANWLPTDDWIPSDFCICLEIFWRNKRLLWSWNVLTLP